MNKYYINFEDKRWNYSYKGFASLINQTIEIALSYCEYNKINHENVEFVVDDKQINQIFPKKHIKAPMTPISSWWLDMFFSKKINNKFDSHQIANLEDLLIKNIYFNKMFDYSYLQNKFEQSFLELNLTDCIGVQIRGTDKKNEIPRIKEDIVLRKIDSFIKESNESFSKIFLCTDDLDYLNSIKLFFGEKNLIYQNAYRSSGDLSVHHNHVFDRNLVNSQVMSDIFALSKTKCMLYTFSNVSHLSLVLGCHNHKNINCLN